VLWLQAQATTHSDAFNPIGRKLPSSMIWSDHLNLNYFQQFTVSIRVMIFEN
jgi:hypothetical protein